MEKSQDSLDIRGLWDLLTDNWQLILLTMLVTAAASLGFHYLQPRTYTAEAKVLFDTPPDSGVDSPETVLEIMRSEELLAEVAERSGQRPAVSERTLNVEAVAGGKILVVRYTADTAEAAQRGADSLADAYIAFTREHREEILEAQLDDLRDQIASANSRLDAVSRRLADGVTPAERARLRDKRRILVLRLKILQRELVALPSREGLQLVDGERIDTGSIPSSSGFNPRRAGAVGAFLGFALGMLLAILRRHLATGFRDEDHVTEVTEVPTLASIPIFDAEGPEPLVATSPRSPSSEAYRELRTRLERRLTATRSGSIIVIAPTPGAGATTTAINLAASFAQAGHRVVLVSANLRAPSLHERLGVNHQGAFNDLLQGGAGAAQSVGVGSQTVDVLTSIASEGNQTDILASADISNALNQLKTRYDRIIIAAPPLLASADAEIVGSACDYAVLVLDAQRSTTSDAEAAVAKLATARPELLGCVFNRIDPQDSPYVKFSTTDQ